MLPSDAALLIGKPAKFINTAIKNGSLKARKVHNHYDITQSDLETWLAESPYLLAVYHEALRHA